MRDRVWDRISLAVRKTIHNNGMKRLLGAAHGTTPSIPADHADGANRYRFAANFEHDSRASNDRS